MTTCVPPRRDRATTRKLPWQCTVFLLACFVVLAPDLTAQNATPPPDLPVVAARFVGPSYDGLTGSLKSLVVVNVILDSETPSGTVNVGGKVYDLQDVKLTVTNRDLYSNAHAGFVDVQYRLTYLIDWCDGTAESILKPGHPCYDDATRAIRTHLVPTELLILWSTGPDFEILRAIGSPDPGAPNDVYRLSGRLIEARENSKRQPRRTRLWSSVP